MESLRKIFEARQISEGCDVTRLSTGDYLLRETQIMWEGFCIMIEYMKSKNEPIQMPKRIYVGMDKTQTGFAYDCESVNEVMMRCGVRLMLTDD